MQDLPSIVAAQTGLRVLGVYTAIPLEADIIDSMRCLYDSLSNRTTWPVVFMMETPALDYFLLSLTFVPAFYLPGQVPSICREVVASLAQDLRNRYLSRPQDLEGITLCLNNISKSNIDRVRETMEALIAYFPNCWRFNVAIRDFDDSDIMVRVTFVPKSFLQVFFLTGFIIVGSRGEFQA